LSHQLVLTDYKI